MNESVMDDKTKDDTKDNNVKKGSMERKDFVRSTIFIVLGVVISIVYVILFAYTMTLISAKTTYDTTVAVKKDMLRENVENMIIFLDRAADVYKKDNPTATDKDVEDEMYKMTRDRIYSEHYLDGSYMWVQKVLNYDGGDNYAIRLIHPNLKDTEGDYLSTNEVNPMGIKAYEQELEGVKADGSVYLNYEFKKLDSDDVTKKVTYSRLYKRFDWIICMGVNVDELDHYQVQAEENMQIYQILVLVAIVATWIILLLIMSHAFIRQKIKAYVKKNKELSARLNRDKLTHAGSRDYGDRLLKKEFEAFRKGKRNTLILMMDVDFFKHFNDEYGHDVGDKVLVSFVDAIKNCISDKDTVIRWGGDEFIVIFQNVNSDKQPEIGDRLLNAIRSITIEGIEKEHPVTTSMGFAYFDSDDTEVADTLNRADEALYRAKESGRDNWKI